MVSSARFGQALYGGALYGVNPAWQVDSGVRWDFIVQTCPSGSRHLGTRYDGGEPLTDLIGATDKKVTFRLSEPSSIAWTLPHSDPACAVIRELSTDVVVWRNGVRLERGRIGASSDDLDSDTGTASFSAVDYRALLDRRILPQGFFGNEGRYQFTQWDQADIAWRLAHWAQESAPWSIALGAGEGRWLNLSRGEGQVTGRLRDRTYPIGTEAGRSIQQLSEVIDGFDWSISPTGSFDIHYPRRGVHRDFVAHYGANVSSLRRSVDSSSYANHVRQSGAEEVTPSYVWVENPDDRPEGAWDVQLGDPDVTESDTLIEKAQGELEARQLIPSYVLTLTPGAWNGPETFWLGDTIRLVARSGHRLDVDTDVRVVEIAVDIGDDGGEAVQVTCGRPEPSMYRASQSDRSRLTNLERR